MDKLINKLFGEWKFIYWLGAAQLIGLGAIVYVVAHFILKYW